MTVTSAVLASAVLHAVWNALAHRAADRTAAVLLVHTGLLLVTVPLLPFVPVPDRAAWPYLAVALVVHLGYVVLLARSYALGDFGQVYPLARGSAPLVVAAAAWAFGDRPSPAALLGVAVVCAGLMTLVGARVRSARAVPAAVTTGLFIAAYTVIDGLGVRVAGTALGYAVWLLGAHALTVVGYGLVVYRGRAASVVRDGWWVAVVGGGLGWASYALVLWAQTRGAMAAVAALRETSVVVAALIGTLVLGERFGRRRVAAAVLVAVGVVLLNL